MDEVDIDNVEDLNELEARLYAQIHHESADTGGCVITSVEELPPVPATVRHVTATSVVNKNVGNKIGRYWSDGDNSAKQRTKPQQTQTEIPFEAQIASKETTAKKPAAVTGEETNLKDIAAISTKAGCSKSFNQDENCAVEKRNETLKNSKKAAFEKPNETPTNANNVVVQTSALQTSAPTPSASISDTQSSENLLKSIDIQQEFNRKTNKDLRFNPASKKQHRLHKDHTGPTINLTKNAPFARQTVKLGKALRIESKKQKSKRAKKRLQVETIVLESSEGSEDDVIAVPLPPAQTYTIDDSDEEYQKVLVEVNKPSEVAIEENAQDAADVVMDTSKSFVKPYPSVSGNEQQSLQQNASRCNSPSSVLSSDDFIGQNDRCRLLEYSGAADDEDLIMLTADVDSLMETPQTRAEDETVEVVPIQHVVDSSNALDCTEFVKPSKAKTSKNQYRVDQTQFRALDVYESESDMMESVYTRCNRPKKDTIIRSVDSSSDSDDVDDIAVVDVRQKMQRLRKRCASGSIKDTEKNNDDVRKESENDLILDERANATSVPFISRGPAVEGRVTFTRHDSVSSLSSSRRASAGGGSVGQMSDNEFIATLNTLAQAGNEVVGEEQEDEAVLSDNSDEIEAPTARTIAEQVLRAEGNNVTFETATAEENNDGENSDNSENEAAPTARSMGEQIIAAGSKQVRETQTTAGIVRERSISGNALTHCASEAIEERPLNAIDAVPDDSFSHLSNIFDAIDNMDKRKRTDVISSDTDSDNDVTILDDQQPEPASTPVISTRRKVKREKETGDPVYNIVYSEEKCFAGGLGWNDEMRRFYNDSWKGEQFNVGSVLNRMDPNKALWKIYTEDRFPKTRRLMNLKCHNCCEFGHTRAKCTRPRKPLTCYMCGERGHYEPRCPNTICLRCGNKTHVFTKSCNACSFQNRLICPVCKVRGHTLNLCPDKWRRYHSTIEPNKYPNSEIEYKKKKNCCICAGYGHLADTCKSSVRFLEYPIFVSHVKSHQKSYSDQSFRGPSFGIGFNLLYRPDQDVSFELAENTTSQNYYGRFLNAVGMGYMLKRKRKTNTLTEAMPTKKKKKTTHEVYVANPYSKAGQEARNNRNEPEQVQEVSESGNTVNVQEAQTTESTVAAEPDNCTLNEGEAIADDANEDQEEQEESLGTLTEEAHSSSAFKRPIIISVSSLADSQKATENLVMDSDSNYSFSEHFELPASTAPEQPAASNSSDPTPKESNPKTKPREMEPLPDFIPLNGNEDDDDTSDENLDVGISRRFVTADTDEENEDGEARQLSPLPDLPCEAKIYLTHFHSKYLLSPSGQKFLIEKSKECDIKGRLDWTSVGHVLIIFGLQSDQDRFHRELLLKYRQLTDQMNKKHTNTTIKVPRRVDVLIRFLRENINQLMTNLGSVNEHMKRFKQIEHQEPSKSGLKLADKARRSLNMILLGQAGLREGNFHLDKLLVSLQKLINDYKENDIVNSELRDEIHSHWKVIFTSYRHDNYPELVQHYNKMLTKNRIPKLNIDPILLGDGLINSTLRNEQKKHVEQPSTPMKDKQRSFIVPNPLNPKNSKKRTSCKSPPPPAPSMKVPSSSPNLAVSPASSMNKGNQVVKSNYVPPTNLLKLKNISSSPEVPPFANPLQKSSSIATKIREATQKWETTCDSLLSEIDDSSAKKGPRLDSKAPSMFWSRESFKFIDECIKHVNTNNTSNLLEKLQRVQKKSQSGLLSYNDYRAVIKIHNTILGK